MRAYNIVITNPKTGEIIRPPWAKSAGWPATYTSFVNGKSLPNALNIEIDIPFTDYAEPIGSGWLRIWGISLTEISQAVDLVGMDISVFGGMQAGLPLANPKQYGLLLRGKVYQSLGNWQGTDQTLDLFVYPDTGTLDSPKNIVLNWLANTPLSQAIQATLQVAFPDYKININIASNLVQARDEVGFWASLDVFAQWLRQKSTAIIDDVNYFGVLISIADKVISVYDSGIPSTPKAPKAIAFTDLIGQPSWVAPSTVSIKTVLRSDIHVGDFVTMPQVPALIAPGSLFQSVADRAKPTFTGVFEVNVVRHLGNFRQPDADSWVTVFNAFPVNAPANAQGTVSIGTPRVLPQ